MRIAVARHTKERVRASRHGSATRDSITLVLVCFLGLPVGALASAAAPCADPPTDDADATGRWCSTSCPGCAVKLFDTSQSSSTSPGPILWQPSDDSIVGCVCAVVGDGVVLSGRYQVHLSDADDCFVGVGSGQANFMTGDGGLFAGGGDDLICAGDSADSGFYGGDGDDTVHAGGGNDIYFYGGVGADSLDAGGGADKYFYGGDGDDALHAGGGYDKQFHSDAGDDKLYPGDHTYFSDQYFYAGDGDDTLYGDATNTYYVETHHDAPPPSPP